MDAEKKRNNNQNRYFSTDEMNAIKKLEEYRWNYFAWVYDFTLPTINNVAESGLRMTNVYGVPKRNADRPAWGNCAAAGGNINCWKREFLMRQQAVDRG